MTIPIAERRVSIRQRTSSYMVRFKSHKENENQSLEFKIEEENFILSSENAKDSKGRKSTGKKILKEPKEKIKISKDEKNRKNKRKLKRGKVQWTR